jgi:hypothetical protein
MGISKKRPHIYEDQPLRSILYNYFYCKAKYPLLETSFSHSGSVRLFNPKDVIVYYGENNHSDFMESVNIATDSPPQRNKTVEIYPEELIKWQGILDWLKKPDPFETIPPVGLIADDLRIYTQVKKMTDENILLVSNDRALGKRLSELIKEYNFFKDPGKLRRRFSRLSVEGYFCMCAKNKGPGGALFFNMFQKQVECLTDHETISLLSKSFDLSKGFSIVFDYPNILRYSQRISLFGKTVKLSSGGFIESHTLDLLASTGRPIELLEYGEISSKVNSLNVKHPLLPKRLHDVV